MASTLSMMANSALNKLALMGRNTGEFSKAKLEIYSEDKSCGVPDLEFLFNPETITFDKQGGPKEHKTAGADSGPKEWTGSVGRSLKIASVYFDTYDTKESVRDKYINKVEKLVHYATSLHRPPRVVFVWGKFSAANDEYNASAWYVQKVSVQYVMFLNDGTPVRAKVDIELTEATTVQELGGSRDPQSPDHAKVVTVKRGDTLQQVAFREYDDPAEWRRIAEANGIDDPMEMEPGTRLLVPPILK